MNLIISCQYSIYCIYTVSIVYTIVYTIIYTVNPIMYARICCGDKEILLCPAVPSKCSVCRCQSTSDSLYSVLMGTLFCLWKGSVSSFPNHLDHKYPHNCTEIIALDIDNMSRNETYVNMKKVKKFILDCFKPQFHRMGFA